ncbi:MAG TPA: hypothetical protein VGR26_10770 [Acidimicrobiales bacterium]|nr:hypothetical protein [Acidimicrobiales bacterium]
MRIIDEPAVLEKEAATPRPECYHERERRDGASVRAPALMNASERMLGVVDLALHNAGKEEGVVLVARSETSGANARLQHG